MFGSVGSLLIQGRWEFILIGDNVYRAPLAAPVMPDGYRGGARFFCPLWQWTQFEATGAYPFDSPSA